MKHKCGKLYCQTLKAMLHFSFKAKIMTEERTGALNWIWILLQKSCDWCDWLGYAHTVHAKTTCSALAVKMPQRQPIDKTLLR